MFRPAAATRAGGAAAYCRYTYFGIQDLTTFYGCLIVSEWLPVNIYEYTFEKMHAQPGSLPKQLKEELPKDQSILLENKVEDPFARLKAQTQ